MRIYRFDTGVSRPIPAFDSTARIARIVRTAGPTQIGCFYFAPGTNVGYHQATTPQLLLVVAGAGWVRGAEAERTPISAGQAASWAAGEWHETGSDGTMTAIVVECGDLDPAAFMSSDQPS